MYSDTLVVFQIRVPVGMSRVFEAKKVFLRYVVFRKVTDFKMSHINRSVSI